MPKNKLNFSWERFTEDDFNKRKEDLINKKDWNGPALIDVGAVNIELHDPEYSSSGGEPRVFLDYYIGGDTSEHPYSYGTDIPYGHADGSSIPISKIVSLSYEEFKGYLENEVASELSRINNAQNKILLEAERPTVNFDDPKQGAELYITKLAEKVDLAEQKDRRTWQFVRDNHPGYHDDLTIKTDQIFSDNDVYRSVVAGEMSVESAEKYVELRGTKADFAREFIRTEKEILDDAIENWQPEEADEDGEPVGNVPDYIQEFHDVVNNCYDEMDKAVDIINLENEKEKFLKSFSGWELNTTLDIDDSKTVRQYFVYLNESLPGIRQDYDKDGNLVTDLRLVADIDDKTNELDHISIDRINSVTGDVDYDVQSELSNDGKKILHSAEKEIKEYLLNEVAKQEKEQQKEKDNKQSKKSETQKTDLSINDLNKIKNELITQTRSNAINSKEGFSIEKASKLSSSINSIPAKQFIIPEDGIDLQVYNIYKNRPDGWRKYVIDWATNKLPLVDDSSVGSVNYSRSAVRDAVGHIKNKGDLKLITLPYVNELIKNGVMFYEYEDKKRNCTFFNYAHPIEFNGEEFVARLAVRQDRNGNRFYTNEFSEIMKKDGLSIDTGSPELTGDNLTHLSSKIVLQEILNVKDRTKEVIQEQNLEKMFDGKYSIDDGNNRMSFRETLDFYNNEDADRPYSERMNHAVARMLYYSLYLPDDDAGEKRWQICDDVAEKITGGEIKQLFDGISSAQEIADKEAKEKFGYSWQEKTNALSDLLDAPGEATDPDGHPADLDHMIHYFEENTPLVGHRKNLEKAVSRVLMFSIEDFKSLEPENYDDITQDGAAAELRYELEDRIASDLVSGKIKDGWTGINKKVEDYSKEIADREFEKLKEDGRFVEAELSAERAVRYGESDFYSKNFTAGEKQKFERLATIIDGWPEKLSAVLSFHLPKGSLNKEESSLIDKYLFTDVDCLRFDRDKGDLYLQRHTDDAYSKFTRTSLKGVLELSIENAEKEEDAGAVLTLQKRLNELRGFNQAARKSEAIENSTERQAYAQREPAKEDVFGDFVSQVEAEYKDLRLFMRSASNVLRQLPPEKKDEVRKELLKRGANTPEKLAVVMRNAVKAKQHTKPQQQKNPEKQRDDYGMER